MNRVLPLLLALASPVLALAEPTTWAIDPTHTQSKSAPAQKAGATQKATAQPAAAKK
jgi:hypothetical protein